MQSLHQKRSSRSRTDRRTPIVRQTAPSDCFRHKHIMKTLRRSRRTNKTKKRFLYNPNNPKKSFDVYIDKDPSDTIPIKYTTVDDVKDTIDRLETLYKTKKYPHKRIWQVGMIMKVRLEVIKNKKPDEYKLSKKYFDFLRRRTKLDEDMRYKTVFV